MLNDDFKEFIGFLNKHKVEYLLIGGYAVAFHGHPRYTKDIDFLIHNTQANALKVLAVLNDFGFSSLKLDEQDFTEENNIIQLGYPPRRIDILTTIRGCAFAPLCDNMQKIIIDKIEINVISKKNLVKIKKIAGRHQDLADIETLEGS